MEYAIEIKDIWKKYRLYHDRSYTLKETLLFRNRNRFEDLWVLKGVDLCVEQGQTIGLIGQNGSGKSTLLKLMTRIIYPDQGTIKINGKVTSLLELGAGFHPDFTGLENIYMNAAIFGMTKKEIEKKIDDIVDFSELGDFITSPVRTYSSGMYLRLAFAVAINVDADVLLIDEILAVGDENFQTKCFTALGELKNDKTIVIVTHDPDVVRKICNRAIWLQNGKIERDGQPHKVVDSYHIFMTNIPKTDLPKNIIDTDISEESERSNTHISEHFEAKISLFKIYNDKLEDVQYIYTGDILNIEYEIESFRDLDDPHYGIIIRDRFGVSLFETNTQCMGISTKALRKGERARVKYSFNCHLLEGVYNVTIGVANKTIGFGLFAENILLKYDYGSFNVVNTDDSKSFGGYLNLNPRVMVN